MEMVFRDIRIEGIPAILLIPVQVGSRGFVDIDSFQHYVGASKRRWRQMVTDVATAAIKGSFKIWPGFKKPSSSVVLSSVVICMFAIYVFFLHLLTLLPCILCFFLYTLLFISVYHISL